MSKFKELVLAWILSMINGFDSNVNNVSSILSKDIFNGSLYEIAKEIQNIIKPVALTIVVVVFLIEFLKITMQMDMLKWEFFVKIFFKACLAKAAIDGSFTLLSAIYATVADWIIGVGNAGSTLGDTVSVVLEGMINSMGFWEVLGLLISMGVVFLAIWITGLLIQVIAYGRIFELLAYLSVSPIPNAFLPMDDGMSRITKKYYLSFAGICMQGLFILISIKLYNAICSDTLLDAINHAASVSDLAYNMLIGSLVLVMAVVKSGQWAKSILDAA